MTNWLEQQLSNGKILVRGEIYTDKPFYCHFELYILHPNMVDEPSLVRCDFSRNEYFPRQPEFRYIQVAGGWQEAWRSNTERWENFWRAPNQLVITSATKGAGLPVSPIHYLPQLYGLVEALRSRNQGIGGMTTEAASVFLSRLRTVYKEKWLLVHQATSGM